jgi:hypothetical protein
MAILFADISGSTSLYELLGDAAARHRINCCMELLSSVVSQYDGRVVKTNGDDMLCVFEDGERATLAACGMQEVLAETSEATEPVLIAMSVRIGMHIGPALIEAGDVYGDAVNIAARMVAQAKTGQIITTRQLVETLPAMLQGNTRHIDHTEVRGKKDAFDLYEVLWQQEETTLMSADLVVRPAAGNLLLLQIGQRAATLDRSIRHLVIGRSKGADIQVDEVMASRLHARLEYRRGKFFLIDQSTNGTYVRLNGEERFVRREEILLAGAGVISLGRTLAEAGDAAVHFEVREQTAE